MASKELILASASPYKKLQLEASGIPFKAIASGVDEDSMPGEAAQDRAKRLAMAKAKALKKSYPQALIIGSDQVVVCEGEIFNKPEKMSEGIKQLQFMSGKKVEIFSALVLLNAATSVRYATLEKTVLQLRALSDEFIKAYFEAEPDAVNTAGGIKSEGRGMLLIASAHNHDPNAIIGLPMYFLIGALLQERIPLL